MFLIVQFLTFFITKFCLIPLVIYLFHTTIFTFRGALIKDLRQTISTSAAVYAKNIKDGIKSSVSRLKIPYKQNQSISI